MLYNYDKTMDYRDLVSQLPVSAHQCFISGFEDESCLSHYKDTLPRIEFSPCNEPRTREAHDSDSTFVRAEKPDEWPIEYWEVASRRSCQVTWTETKDRTKPLKTTGGFSASDDARSYHLFRSSKLPLEVDEGYLREHWV